MTIKTVYQCSRCEETHSGYYAAEECCQPEVYTLYQCPECSDTYDTTKEAEACCYTGQISCPSCTRLYTDDDIAAAAIELTDHCPACNPFYSISQQHDIERLHYDRTGLLGSLAHGDKGHHSASWYG